MNNKQRFAILLGVLGLTMILVGIKPFISILSGNKTIMPQMGTPVILFITIDDPCECMDVLMRQAELQIANWSVEQRAGIPIERLEFNHQMNLQAKYDIFRAPSLVLVDNQDQVAWRQDYPLIEGGPFKPEEIEAAIAELER